MKNIWAIVGAVVVVLLIVFLCIGSFGMLRFARMGGGVAPGMAGRFGNYGMMGGFNPFGWIVPLILLAVIVVGIVLFVIWFVNRKSNPTMTQSSTLMTASTESTLDILKMRYAKGEITKEQFDSMKHDLGITDA
jgi:uncharacterized membrane protein